MGWGLSSFTGGLYDAVFGGSSGGGLLGSGGLLGKAAGFVQDTFSTIGAVASNIAKNPLPVLETLALTSLGVPPALANAAVSVLNGGDIKQIALAAAGQYLTSAVASGVSGALSKSDLAAGLDTATKDVVSAIVSSATPAAAMAALKGGSFQNILEAGAKGAMVGSIKSALSSAGISPKDDTYIGDVADQTLRQVLQGKPLGESIAASATAVAIGNTIETLSGQQINNQSLLNSAYAKANDAKQKASQFYANSVLSNPAELQKIKTLQSDAQSKLAAATQARNDYIKMADLTNRQQQLATEYGNGDPAAGYKRITEVILPGLAKTDPARYQANMNTMPVGADGTRKWLSPEELLAKTNELKEKSAAADSAYQTSVDAFKAQSQAFKDAQATYDGLYKDVNLSVGQVNLLTQQQRDIINKISDAVVKYEGALKSSAVNFQNTAVGAVVNQAKQDAAAQKLADEKRAQDAGFKSFADMTTAKGATAPDFYAKQAGFSNADDQNAAKAFNMDSKAFYADKTAKAAGFQNAADYTAAKGIPADLYYAKKAGFATAADMKAAQAAGIGATDFNNNKKAAAAGFATYGDYLDATKQGRNSADYYAGKKGFANGADAAAAAAKGITSGADYYASLSGFKNAGDMASAAGLPAADFYAKQAGFLSAADQKAALASNTPANEFYAKKAGFKTAADQAAANGASAANFYASKEGFLNATDYTNAKNAGQSADAYYAAQKGFDNAADMKAAAGKPAVDFYAAAKGFENANDYLRAKSVGLMNSPGEYYKNKGVYEAGFTNINDYKNAVLLANTQASVYNPNVKLIPSATQANLNNYKIARAAGYDTYADYFEQQKNARYYPTPTQYYNGIKGYGYQRTPDPIAAASLAGFDNAQDQKDAAAAGKTAAVFNAEKNASQYADKGFMNSDDMIAAAKLGLGAMDYYSQKLGFANAVDRSAAAGKSATDYYNDVAKSFGFSSGDDYLSAKKSNVLAPDFYAQKAGFKNAAEQKEAGSSSPQQYYDNKAAQALGYKDAAEKAAAGNMSAVDYRATQAGFKNAGDQSLAKSAGQDAATFYLNKATKDGGFNSVSDYQRATGQGLTAPDYYARMAGFNSANDRNAAIAANITKSVANANGFANEAEMYGVYKDALDEGFKGANPLAVLADFKDAMSKKVNAPDYYAQRLGYRTYEDQQEAGGLAPTDFYYQKAAAAAGFKTASDMAAAKNRGVDAPTYYALKAGYASVDEQAAANGLTAAQYRANLAAQASGFKTAADQTAAKGMTSAEYYARQAGFNSSADQKAAAGTDATTFYRNKDAQAAGFTDYAEQQKASSMGIGNGADYQAKIAGFNSALDQFAAGKMSAYDFYNEKAAAQQGFKSYSDMRAANALGQDATTYNNEKAAAASNFRSYADMQAANGMSADEFYGSQNSSALGFKNYQDMLNAAGKSATEYYQDKEAQAVGFKNAVDKIAANGTPASQYYAQQEAYSQGFLNPEDYKAAAGIPATDFYSSKAGFKNASDMAAADGLNPQDYYAQQAGFMSYADQQAAGQVSPADYYATQQAKMAGFRSVADMSAAGTTPATEYYAKKAGFTDYATQQAAKALGYVTPSSYNAYLSTKQAAEKAAAAISGAKPTTTPTTPTTPTVPSGTTTGTTGTTVTGTTATGTTAGTTGTTGTTGATAGTTGATTGTTGTTGTTTTGTTPSGTTTQPVTTTTKPAVSSVLSYLGTRPSTTTTRPVTTTPTVTTVRPITVTTPTVKPSVTSVLNTIATRPTTTTTSPLAAASGATKIPTTATSTGTSVYKPLAVVTSNPNAYTSWTQYAASQPTANQTANQSVYGTPQYQNAVLNQAMNLGKTT